MTPNARERDALSDSGRHVRHFVLRILRCWNSGSAEHLYTADKQPTEVEVGLARQDQRFRFDALHRGCEVPIVRLLCGAVSRLPGVEHDEHVLRVCTVSSTLR